MKIIHCADIHIGSVMQNLPSDLAKIRKRETLDSFFRMLAFAKERAVDAVIIAGDLFDTKIVARSVRKEVLEAIAGCPQTAFLCLRGNHDSKTELEDADLPAPDNFFRFDSFDDWKYFDFGDVCIGGIDIFRQNGFGFYEKLKFDKSKFNIAVLHGDFKTIQLERLQGKNIDFLALGDIHIPDMTAKRLDNRGVFGYSGCLEGRGYDEVGDRGFFLLEIERGKMNREFFSVAKRKYEVVELDIYGLDSHTKIDNRIRELTEPLNKENIVRVVLKGKRSADTHIGTDALQKKLCERFFYANIKDQTRLDMNSVSFDSGATIGNKFVDLVKKSGLSDDQKDKIIAYGIKALLGEGIEL